MLTDEEKKNLDKYQVKEEDPLTYFTSMDDNYFWHAMNYCWAERHSFSNPYVGDEKYGWKFHIHADNNEDWQKVSSVVIPYLADKGITFKTYNMFTVQESGFYDKTENQYGKAFTIYPNNDEEFIRIANDLNYILENNNLNQQGVIHGDHQIGDYGRLFYRNTWTSKDNPVYRANAYAENPVYKADDMDDPFLNVLGYPNDNSKADALAATFGKKEVVNKLAQLKAAEDAIAKQQYDADEKSKEDQRETSSSSVLYDVVVLTNRNQIIDFRPQFNDIKVPPKGEYNSVLQDAEKAQHDVFKELGNWLDDEFYDKGTNLGNWQDGLYFYSRDYSQRMYQEFNEDEFLVNIEIHDLKKNDSDEYDGSYTYKENPRAKFAVKVENLYLQSWSDQNNLYAFNNGELTVTSLNQQNDYESLKFKNGILSEKIALLNGQRIKYQYDAEGHLLGATSPEKDILKRTPVENVKQPKKAKIPPKPPVKGVKSNPLKGKDIAAKLKAQKKSAQKAAAKPLPEVAEKPTEVKDETININVVSTEKPQPSIRTAAAPNVTASTSVTYEEERRKKALLEAIRFAHTKALKDKATPDEIIKHNHALRQIDVPADKLRNVKKETDMMNALAQRRMDGFLTELGKMEKTHKNPSKEYIETINRFLKEFDYPGASGYIPTVRKVRNRLRDFKYSPEKSAETDKPAIREPQTIFVPEKESLKPHIVFVPEKESFWSKAKRWMKDKAQSVLKGIKTAGLALAAGTAAGAGVAAYGAVKLAGKAASGISALKNKIIDMLKAVKQRITDKFKAEKPVSEAKPHKPQRSTLWQKAKNGLNKVWQKTKKYIVGAAIFVSGFLLGKQCSDTKVTEEKNIPLQEQSVKSEVCNVDDGKTIQMPLPTAQKKEVRHAESDAKAYYDSAIKLQIGEQKREALYTILEQRAEKGELNLGHFPVERYAHSMVMYQKIQPGNEINKLFNKVVGGKKISAVDNIKMNKAVHQAGAFGDGIKGIGKDSAFDRSSGQDKQQHLETRKEYRKSAKGKADMLNKARNNLQVSR
ncbi:MAG: hypothetical protein J6L86_05525 [Alphaproteobacteria bacterium]|nr:hypothetical protein [Alphaproteobacteria bacterium]